eukprot:TRINITY_DN26818_c0_g1_i1.p1 TRINITY_DN26818_c0_g1~~TRINITY_DN26818_c0_g1_i1.p1  ORF type:complete len:637 (-),score=45.53 TRINITY_DN26818_c0_g1_i1:84-1904(-)
MMYSRFPFWTLCCLGVHASHSGAGLASDFHQRFISHGVRSDRHPNFFIGAASVSHHETEQPPSGISLNACSTRCAFDPPHVLNRSGDVYTVKWKMNDVTDATDNDWVGLFDHFGPNNEYLDYFHAATGWDGVGQRTLQIYNIRTTYQFRYFKSGECLCASSPIQFAHGPHEPTQGHISLTGDPSEMQVTWVSGDKSGFVQVEGVNYAATLTSTVDSYHAADMCGPPATTVGPWAFRDVGYIHTVTIKGLKPQSKYRYRFGTDEAMSEYAEFQTEPDADTEWTAIAYGDMGVNGNPNVDTIYGYMKGPRLVQLDTVARNPNLVVHFGDLSYARSTGFIWDIWGDQISPLARKVPYMVSLGNHEYDHASGNSPDGLGTGFHPSWGNYGDDSAGECGVPVQKRFPNPPSGGNSIFWYSFNYANTHWVMLSSEHNYTSGSDQYNWLLADLEKVDRSKTPWLIVTAHRPAYNSEDYQGDWDVALNFGQRIDDVLLKYKVNLFLAGHYHSYQRTCPVAHMKCRGSNEKASAPIHITVGSAGGNLDYAAEKPEGHDWTIRTAETFGSLLLKVRPEKIVAEFWAAEDYDTPSLPFHLMDTFEVHPFADTFEHFV